MLTSLHELPETEALRAQVVVVGSGPAGTEVATYLAAQGRQVIVLESGRDGFDPAYQALNDADFIGRPHRAYQEGADFHDYLPREYRGQNRLRQFGGTSCSWTGKWRVFEPRDFEPRPWLPNSGWPIGFNDMRESYAEVARDYGLGIGDGQTFDAGLRADAQGFGRAGFKVVPYFQHPQAYRAADRLRGTVSDRLSIVIDATVTRIDLAEGSDRVAGLVCRSIGGAERRIEAEHVVLAAGGLETPRLLLASTHQHPAGLGNGHDLVGRFYQDHLKINHGKLVPGALLARHAAAVQTQPRPRVMLCLGLPAAEQERLGVLEATLFFRPRYANRLARLRGALLRRPKVRDASGVLGWYSMKYALEQAVNRESRVRLAPERDAMGVPRLVVDWRLTDLDRRSFEVSARELARLGRASGLGELDLGSDPADIDRATDSAHHMGTTRMGAHPRDGVVDTDCAVFGLPNLHVASASVFATGAAYSPTFTIVALARRLAKRLDAQLGKAIEPVAAPDAQGAARSMSA